MNGFQIMILKFVLIHSFSFWYGVDRPRWLGPISYGYPSYLNGDLPGDYGFDVAALAKDPVALHKYFKYVITLVSFPPCLCGTLIVEFKYLTCPFNLKLPLSFEILHARWAMLASVGALIPELLDLLGAFHFVEPVWWRVGYSKLQVSTFYYLFHNLFYRHAFQFVQLYHTLVSAINNIITILDLHH